MHTHLAVLLNQDRSADKVLEQLATPTSTSTAAIPLTLNCLSFTAGRGGGSATLPKLFDVDLPGVNESRT